MKNLKLSWELSSNLQLQSENEVIRCTAFDIEQNRFFFASSANFIYTIHLSSSQNEESWGKSPSVPLVETIDLDPDDSITSLEYLMEKEALIIGTSSGVLLLYNVDDNVTEVVGRVEGGVKSLSPSPDGDLLCIITGLGQMLVMTHDWDLLYEISLEDSDTCDQDIDSECSASWRGDGKFFATITTVQDSSHKKLKIWERDTGNLHSVSEPKSFMGETVEWMPSGAKIATVCDHKEEKKPPSVVFFERNGLQRSSFTVNNGTNSIDSVNNLKWNCNSDLLAATVRMESHDSINIWSFSNNHWYSKQEIRYLKQDGVKFMWDPTNPNRLISWTLKGTITVHNFIWITAVTDNNSVALVIDGSKILVTPLSIALIPPPMCLFELQFPFAVREMAFWSFKNSLAASLSDGSLSVVELPDIDTWQDLEGEVFKIELTILENPTPFLHLTWVDSHTLLGVSHHGQSQSQTSYIHELEIVCSENHIPGVVTCSGYIAKNSNVLSLDKNLIVIAIASNSVKKHSAFIQSKGGNIFEYTETSSLHEYNNLQFSQSCPWMRVSPIEEPGALPSFLLFGLDNNGKLHVNQNIISNNCHSFSLYSNSQNQEMTHLVLLTKQDFLYIVDIRDIVSGQTEVKHGNFVPPVTINKRKDEEGKKFIQIWEKGSKILGVVHGDESCVVIQTPRGNLETVYPRKLVLESIVNALSQGRFRDSLSMVRRHRIDFNVIVDYKGWEDFLNSANEFVIQADNLNHVTEFVCSLKNENVMETLYKNYLPNNPNIKDSKDVNNKVNSVLLAIRKALESQIPESQQRELCILTTLAKTDPPALEQALARVKNIRELELSESTDPKRLKYPSSEESLKHLLWLSESESLFEAALGLYDLNLSAIVALNSQQDPKEFLPFLQQLEHLPPGVMKYTIDLKLKRYEKALHHIFQSGDSHFPEFLQLVKNNPKLFPLSLQLVIEKNPRNQVLNAYGDHLSDTKLFKDAADSYLSCGEFQKGMKMYRACNDWKGVVTIAGMMNMRKDEITLLANEMCEELQTIGKPGEAAKIAMEYCKDYKTGVNLLVSGREWEEALRVALMVEEGGMVEEVVAAAVECGGGLVGEYEEGVEKVGKYLARYLAVRQRRLVLAAKIQAEEERVGNELDDDAVSEASSSFSGMSAYTTGTRKDSTASMTSSTTSKRGQRRQKKKGKIRAGSPDEEMALVDHLKGMSLTAGATRELKSLLGCLIMIGKQDMAKKLQRSAESFQLCQMAAVKIASDAMGCEIVDEERFVLEVYVKKLRKELLESEEFSWQSKVFVAP
ncbi:hypothetical protein LXL04_021955 [Taraxacum kok-saghyz]